MNTSFTQQLNTEIEKLKSCDYTTYQNFYNETSQYLYGVIWNMVQDQNTADTLIQELYTNIYTSIASELTDNSQFYIWAENKAQMLATTYLTTHGAAGAYAVTGGVVADEAVAAVAANAGVDVAVGAGQAGVGTAAVTAGQAGMGTAAAGAGQAGVGTVAGVSGISGASGAGIASGIAHVGMSLGAKIAIGIAATAVTVGGGLGLHHVIEDREKPTETTTEIVEEIATGLDAATDSDAVEFAEAVVDVNPTFAGYYLERVTDDGDKGKAQGCIHYFQFVGDNTPVLKNSFETWQNEMLNDYYASLDSQAEQAESEWAAQNPEFYEFWVESRVECERADNRVLTVTNYMSRPLNGEGGDGRSITSANFDVQTGKILTLDDIGDVKGDIKKAIIKYHNDADVPSDWVDRVIDDQIADNSLIWGMSYGYFFVWYDTAWGFDRAKIPYSELPGIKPEYLPEENMYLGEIGYVFDYYDDSDQFDIDGDGIVESVGIYPTWGQDGASSTIHLGIDGTAVTEEFSTEEDIHALLCSTGEKTYIILEMGITESSSEYRIYDVSSGATVEIQRFTDILALPIGPYPTARKTRIDVLGTYNGYKIYNLGPEGLTTDYNYYIFEDAEEIILTAKADIPCKYEKDGMLGEGTIPAGTVIHPVECDTDNHVFVFRMEDGTRGRFYYGQDENGITINGVPETELFENLPYTE